MSISPAAEASQGPFVRRLQAVLTGLLLATAWGCGGGSPSADADARPSDGNPIDRADGNAADKQPSDLPPSDGGADRAAADADVAADARDGADLAPDAPISPDVSPDARDVAAETSDAVPDTADAASDSGPDAGDLGPAPDAGRDAGPPVVLFQDDFESGGLARWSSTSGNPTVNAGCALGGSFGLRLPSDTIFSALKFNLPSGKKHLRLTARVDMKAFRKSPLVPADSTIPILSLQDSGAKALAAVGYSFEMADLPALHGFLTLAGGGFAFVHADAITAAAHQIEIEWVASAGASTADGSLRLLVDGKTSTMEPNLIDRQATGGAAASALVVSVQALGGSSGFVCIDDVVLFEIP